MVVFFTALEPWVSYVFHLGKCQIAYYSFIQQIFSKPLVYDRNHSRHWGCTGDLKCPQPYGTYI